jgi:hypothetical protein
MRGTLVILLLFSSMAHAAPKQSQGRFQLVQLGKARSDQFMIDTETGRVWTRFCTKIREGAPTDKNTVSTGDCDEYTWLQDDVENINFTFAADKK